ncbi:MAG: hypothetical protein Q8R55_01100, partial [Candidatus Taylorbacteria bacterium]|nr:hypothetical protein [Candidatus Taylorbacteria bacterium]
AVFWVQNIADFAYKVPTVYKKYGLHKQKPQRTFRLAGALIVSIYTLPNEKSMRYQHSIKYWVVASKLSPLPFCSNPTLTPKWQNHISRS